MTNVLLSILSFVVFGCLSGFCFFSVMYRVSLRGDMDQGAADAIVAMIGTPFVALVGGIIGVVVFQYWK